MSGMNAAVVIGGVWAGAYAIRLAVQVLLPSVNETIEENNVELMFGYFKWQTARYNATLEYIGKTYARVLQIWFELGAYIGLVVTLLSIVLLVVNLVWLLTPFYELVTAGRGVEMANTRASVPEGVEPSQVRSMAPRKASWSSGGEQEETNAASYGQPILTPLIPGVNVPLEQFWCYFLALLASGVFHEFGHAIAAASENVAINGVGMIVMAVYPGGFVNMNERDLLGLRARKQLRIYTAGAWHNIVLSLVCLALIYALPVVVSPVYVRAEGVAIVSVAHNSPVVNYVGEGDIISAVDDCQVPSRKDWDECLLAVNSNPPRKYCVESSILEKARPHTECCTRDQLDIAPLQCFSVPDDSIQRNYYNVCMSARSTMKGDFCFSRDECATNSRCVKPVLSPYIRLVHLSVAGKDASDVYFAGHPGALWTAVVVSDWYVRWPAFSILPDEGPHTLERLLQYIVAFSGAMAVLNLAPVYMLDGQWVTRAAVEMLLFDKYTRPQRRRIETNILYGGTALFAVNLVGTLVLAASGQGLGL